MIFIQEDGSLKNIYGELIQDKTGMFTPRTFTQAVDAVGDG